MTRTVSFSFVLVLVLHTLAFSSTLSGVIRDPDGRPVAGARVMARSTVVPELIVESGADGVFQTPDLPHGVYDVRVMKPGFSAEPQRVTLGDQQVTLTFDLRVSAVTESVVVSAAHVSLPLSEAASAITVISGDELHARQIRTVGDALSFVPGLSVARNGSSAGLTSLFTRGGESDFTLVLLDGMRVNAFGGGIDLAQVPLVDVERVEIVRGPQSAVFGSDAIGGVVQIVTRRSDHDRVDGLLEAGTLASVRGRVGLAGGRRGWSWQAGLERAADNGYSGMAPATGTRVSNDDGKAHHIGLGLGWRRGGRTLGARLQLSSTERGFPGPYGSNPIGAYTSIDTVSRGNNDRRQVALDWSEPLGGTASRVRLHTQLAFADFDSQFASPFGMSDTETRRLSVRTQTHVVLSPRLDGSAGVELQRERAGSTFITGAAAQPIPIERWVSGYFAEARLTPATRWAVAAGVRVERIGRDPLEADPFAFQPRPAFAGESIVSTNPRVSVSYTAPTGGEALRVRASAGSGIRPPDALEIAFTDNPRLRPERAHSFDAGLQQTFAGGRGVAEVTFFTNRFDDLIVAVGRSLRDASRFRTDNISNARARGVELAFGARPQAGLDLRAAYTWLDTKILSLDRAPGQAPSPYTVGDALIRRPRHQGSLTASYSAGRISMFAQAVFRGDVRDVEPSFGAFGGVFTASGYGVVDLGASVRLVGGLVSFIRVENTGNRRYESAFGFPAPGALTMVGLRFAAGR